MSIGKHLGDLFVFMYRPSIGLHVLTCSNCVCAYCACSMHITSGCRTISVASDVVVPDAHCHQASLINPNDCYSKWNSHSIPNVWRNCIQCAQVTSKCKLAAGAHDEMPHAMCLYIFHVVRLSIPFVCVVRVAVHARRLFSSISFLISQCHLYRHKILKDKWHSIFDIFEMYLVYYKKPPSGISSFDFR